MSDKASPENSSGFWRMLRRPSAKYSLLTLVVGGFAAGIVFWGGFHTVVEATNTETFCIGCHEMRNNVYEEYKKTIHYNNRTGVRAVCSDCHVPKEWGAKMLRKIQATREVYGKLTGSIDTSVDATMFDIDLVDAQQSVIDALHAKGRVVVCYFSAGSREDWRPDAKDFKAGDYGKGLAGWPGENWLDVRSANVRAVMQKRLDLAVSKKCDGVEPDNVDGYANDSGFPLTKANQIDYNKFLASESHSRGLSVGLKNSVELVTDLLPHFDWALNEECLSYSECTTLAPFIKANKAVFHVEYVDKSSQGAAKKSSVCGKSSIAGFSTLIKTWDLDAWRLSCP